MNNQLAAAYGGVVFDTIGHVLLREPANHFGGYIWTFPKGKANAGESPEEAALREVREETGCQARIIAPIPGDFKGDTSVNHYFLMVEVNPGAALGEHDSETAKTRWVSENEAVDLIYTTPNEKGRLRDLAVLEASVTLHRSLIHY